MIASTSNQRVKEARKLHERRHRATTGRLLLEGVRLINDAWQSGTQPDVLFYLPEQLNTIPAAVQLLAQLTRARVETVACTPEVFATLAETVTPQGLVAVVPLPNLPLPQLCTFTLVLDQVRDPGNAGTLLRSAEAAGVDLVICTPGTVDLFNEKAVRAGMGAHFRLPLRLCSQWTEVRTLLHPQQQLYLAEASATVAYDQVDWSLPVALIVGGEAEGASVEARQLATPVTIPMQGTVESLNAAVAGAVMLFEAARQRRVLHR